MRFSSTQVVASLSLVVSPALAVTCKKWYDGYNWWYFEAPAKPSKLGIHRFQGDDVVDYCEHYAPKSGKSPNNWYYIPHHGFEDICSSLPETISLPKRKLGADPPCVEFSNYTRMYKKDWTSPPVVTFCNLDVCAPLEIKGAPQKCQYQQTTCFGVCDDTNYDNMPGDWTSSHTIWREPAGYMQLFLNTTTQTFGKENTAFNWEPKCYGKDVIDGKIPEEKDRVDGQTWMQSIKDRLPKNVYWMEVPKPKWWL